jgi:hypothetical protein
MIRPHPQAEAKYEVIPHGSGFAVRVTVPETEPTTVSGFKDAEAARAWLDEQVARVQAIGSKPLRVRMRFRERS